MDAITAALLSFAAGFVLGALAAERIFTRPFRVGGFRGAPHLTHPEEALERAAAIHGVTREELAGLAGIDFRAGPEASSSRQPDFTAEAALLARLETGAAEPTMSAYLARLAALIGSSDEQAASPEQTHPSQPTGGAPAQSIAPAPPQAPPSGLVDPDAS